MIQFFYVKQSNIFGFDLNFNFNSKQTKLLSANFLHGIEDKYVIFDPM